MGKLIPIEVVVASVRRIKRHHMPATCGVPGCDKPHSALNLCWNHYQRFYKWRKTNAWVMPEYEFDDLTPYLQPAKGIHKISVKDMFCHVPGCDKKFLARGLCSNHYMRWYKREKRNG